MITRTALRSAVRQNAAFHSITAARPIQLSRSTLATTVPTTRQFSWTPWKKLDQVTQTIDVPSQSISAQLVPSQSISDPTQPTLVETSTTLPSTDSVVLPQPPVDVNAPSFEDLILHSGKTVEEVLNSEEAIHAAMKVSDLKLIGYDHGFFSITGWFTDAIVSLHTSVGLPWWGAIAATTVAIRLALSPILISTQKHNSRLAIVNPQFQDLMSQAKEASANKDVHMQTLISQRMRDLMKEHNVNPFRSLLLPLVQLPIFLTFFSIIRGLANLPLPQLKEGGLGWVTDLTAADPYCILPATSLLFTNLVFKLGADGVPTASKGDPVRTGHIRNFIQISTLISFPFIMYFPSAILFYWTFSTGFTLLQSIALRQTFVKKLLNLPITPTQEQALDPGAKPLKQPSYLDTFNVIKDWAQKTIKDTQEQTTQNGTANQAGKNRRPQNDFVERIQEPDISSTEEQIRVSDKPVGREAEKQRRIELARRKRLERS
ncbi:hypothetical protein L204_101515 [Cryptococcus depauperatus]|nr:preprotein translocase subunit YidC [Cryptococcus depauperatus CBS 7855]